MKLANRTATDNSLETAQGY